MISALLFLAAPAPVQDAPPTPAEPVASARILTGQDFTLRWHGVGELRAAANMCVSSTTGRYLLEIQTQTTTAPSDPIAYSLVITGRGVSPLVREVRSAEIVQFEGAVAGECGITGNVTVELRFRDQDLSTSIAGRYMERLQFTVRPL